MNNTIEYPDSSMDGLKILLWIAACVIFPPIAAFWIGWYLVSFAIWVLQQFLTVVFTIYYIDLDHINSLYDRQ